MMSTLWTVAAVCLCLGGHPCSETSELKKAIVRMQDLYHVNFVYDSSLEMIRLSGIFSSGGICSTFIFPKGSIGCCQANCQTA